MSIQLFPQTSDRTPWGVAILSLVPLIITGPLSIIISYHPWWDNRQLPWIFTLFTIVAVLSVLVSFALGLLKKFPRWSYPYAIYTVILLTFLVTYLINRTPWDINHEGGILILVVVFSILATWFLPITRPFYANLRRDWTLLSYGLYACTLFLLAMQDHDISPTLTILVLLPSVLGVLGALAHLRLASAAQRVAVLILSMFLGVIIWSIPLINGSLGLLDSFLEVLRLWLVIWAILAVLIAAPILIALFTAPRKQSSA